MRARTARAQPCRTGAGALGAQVVAPSPVGHSPAAAGGGTVNRQRPLCAVPGDLFPTGRAATVWGGRTSRAGHGGRGGGPTGAPRAVRTPAVAWRSRVGARRTPAGSRRGLSAVRAARGERNTLSLPVPSREDWCLSLPMSLSLGARALPVLEPSSELRASVSRFVREKGLASHRRWRSRSRSPPSEGRSPQTGEEAAGLGLEGPQAFRPGAAGALTLASSAVRNEHRGRAAAPSPSVRSHLRGPCPSGRGVGGVVWGGGLGWSPRGAAAARLRAAPGPCRRGGGAGEEALLGVPSARQLGASSVYSLTRKTGT